MHGQVIKRGEAEEQGDLDRAYLFALMTRRGRPANLSRGLSMLRGIWELRCKQMEIQSVVRKCKIEK